MADTPFNAFTLVSSLNDTDLFLAYRAGGGVNFTPLTLAAYAGQHSADGTAALPGMAFGSDPDTGFFRPSANVVAITTAGTESARFLANGNVGIGTTSPTAKLEVAGALRTSADVSAAFALGRYTAGFAGAAVNTHGGATFLALQLEGAGKWVVTDTAFHPWNDNSFSLGTASRRASVVYATSGSINTSDEREKNWIAIGEDRRAKDLRIACAILDELGWYQRLDAVEEKGEDGARWHFGARAQVVWSIVAAEGLCAPLEGKGEKQRPDSSWDGPPPPAWLCFDEWERDSHEQPVFSETILGADGQPLQTGTREVVTREAGNRFGLRTDQLNMLLSWALHERDMAKDAVIADLTARLEALEEPEWRGGLTDGEL